MGTMVQITIRVEAESAETMLSQIAGQSNGWWLDALGLRDSRAMGMVQPYIGTEWPQSAFGYDQYASPNGLGIEFSENDEVAE